MLEPSGPNRGDGKRPDGITVHPYSRGHCIIWDATCVNTFASAKMLKLNDNKTELMLVTSKRTKHLHSLPTSITIGNAQIPLKSL